MLDTQLCVVTKMETDVWRYTGTVMESRPRAVPTCIYIYIHTYNVSQPSML